MARRHWPIEQQGRWLGSVVRGHLAYYSVPGNIHQVSAFRDEIIWLWRAALRRRSSVEAVTSTIGRVSSLSHDGGWAGGSWRGPREALTLA
jgi:RNA-directed DNA polymerase